MTLIFSRLLKNKYLISRIFNQYYCVDCIEGYNKKLRKYAEVLDKTKGRTEHSEVFVTIQ
jgi:hypothetical protein